MVTGVILNRLNRPRTTSSPREHGPMVQRKNGRRTVFTGTIVITKGGNLHKETVNYNGKLSRSALIFLLYPMNCQWFNPNPGTVCLCIFTEPDHA